MGYSTDFEGQFDINPPLSEAHRAYLERFAEVRHGYIPFEWKDRPDPIREAVGLPMGPDGIFYTGDGTEDSFPGKFHSNSQAPGFYCQWVTNEDGTALEWDGNEKFYEYVEWMKFLLTHFLIPWGYKVSGEVEWLGESPDDRGLIVIEDNVLTTKAGKTVYA